MNYGVQSFIAVEVCFCARTGEMRYRAQAPLDDFAELPNVSPFGCGAIGRAASCSGLASRFQVRLILQHVRFANFGIEGH